MPPAKALSRDKIFEIAKSLPPAPKVLADLGTLLRDSDSDLHSVGELIKRDTALAAHIIRIANSVVYGPRGESSVGTVEEAVARVGFKEVYRLVGMVATGRLTERPLKFYGVSTGLLRGNMLYTALVCEALAETCGLDPRTAYTAGLIRTLGILVLDRVAELLPSVEPYNHEAQGSYARWEGLNFVFTHCEVAGMILEEWGFPSDTIEAVRKHYLLRNEDYDEKLACLLNLAGGIVAVAGVSLPGEYNQWDTPSRQAEVLGLTAASINRASERARSAYSSFRTHIEPEGTGSSEVPILRLPPKPAPAPATKAPPTPAAPASVAPPITAKPTVPAPAQSGPWWNNSFFAWPRAARAGFVTLGVFSIALVAITVPKVQSLAEPAWHRVSAWGANRLVDLQGGFAFASSTFDAIPSPWIDGAILLVFGLYTVVFGLIAAVFRILSPSSR